MTLHPPTVDRVQTGVRMERRMVKVLKALAELRDLSLGEPAGACGAPAALGVPAPGGE
jgi:hypothetical protein